MRRRWWQSCEAQAGVRASWRRRRLLPSRAPAGAFDIQRGVLLQQCFAGTAEFKKGSKRKVKKVQQRYARRKKGASLAVCMNV